MSWPSWLLWGFVGTVILTTLMAGSQGLGMTRMNIPYLLGTMFTPNRDRAKLIGIGLHLFNGTAKRRHAEPAHDTAHAPALG